MTYSQVKFLIGGPGELEVSSYIGRELTEIYSWKGNGSVGANANITFQDGKVIGKAQYGLNKLYYIILILQNPDIATIEL